MLKKFLIIPLLSIIFYKTIYAQELNIYSSRKEEFLSEIFTKFSQENNIKINYINDDVYKLISRLESEKSSKIFNADLLMTADAGSIEFAKTKNLLQPMDSESVENLNNFFFDKDYYWAGVSFRARVIAYAKNHISDNNADLQNYLDLSKEMWRKKVIMTPISSTYNQFLIAYILKLHGSDVANNWVKSLIQNNNTPNGSDTEKLKSIAIGRGEIAMVNSYYYFRLLLSQNQSDREIANKIGIVFPNQNELGTHINFSAVGIIQNSKNKEIAEKFVKYILSKEVQEMILNKNKEYSVLLLDKNNSLNKNISDKVIKFDMTTNLAEIAKLIPNALKIAEKNGWN